MTVASRNARSWETRRPRPGSSDERLQALEAVRVEVVRRLVEEQEIGAREERGRERRPGCLAAGEAVERAREVDPEAELGAELRRARLEVTSAEGEEPVERAVVPRGRSRLVGREGERRRGLLELALRVRDPRPPRQAADQRLPRVRVGLLRQVSDGQVGRVEDHRATIRRLVPGEQAQDGGLADAVRADEADPSPCVDRERRVVQDDLPSVVLVTPTSCARMGGTSGIALPRYRALDLRVDTKGGPNAGDRGGRGRRTRDPGAARRGAPRTTILGEEEGARGSEPQSPRSRRWIVDPIDGTRNYSRGIPAWFTLLGLELGRIVGVASAPGLGRRWWARRGGGAFANGEPIRVSTIAAVEDAVVSFAASSRAPDRAAAPACLAPAGVLGRMGAPARRRGDRRRRDRALAHALGHRRPRADRGGGQRPRHRGRRPATVVGRDICVTTNGVPPRRRARRALELVNWRLQARPALVDVLLLVLGATGVEVGTQPGRASAVGPARIRRRPSAKPSRAQAERVSWSSRTYGDARSSLSGFVAWYSRAAISRSTTAVREAAHDTGRGPGEKRSSNTAPVGPGSRSAGGHPLGDRTIPLAAELEGLELDLDAVSELLSGAKPEPSRLKLVTRASVPLGGFCRADALSGALIGHPPPNTTEGGFDAHAAHAVRAHPRKTAGTMLIAAIVTFATAAVDGYLPSPVTAAQAQYGPTNTALPTISDGTHQSGQTLPRATEPWTGDDADHLHVPGGSAATRPAPLPSRSPAPPPGLGSSSGRRRRLHVRVAVTGGTRSARPPRLGRDRGCLAGRAPSRRTMIHRTGCSSTRCGSPR